MGFIIIIACIVALILLITWGKLNPFLAFLIVSITGGLMLGIPLEKISSSVVKGMCVMLGSVVVVLASGAMVGEIVAESGGAEQITATLMEVVSTENVSRAMMVI